MSEVKTIATEDVNMMELNEQDLSAVGKIQELKNCTIAKAKEIYRKHAKQLANPDVEGRDEIILDNIKRGSKSTEFDTEAMEDTPVKPKKEKKAKAAKEPKAKAKKEPKADKEPTPDVPLPELEREVELKSVDEEPNIYTANLFGKKHAIVLAERNRTSGVKGRFQAIGFSKRRLDAVQQYAKANDLPLAIAAVVRVKGKLDQGYAIPKDVFKKFECKEGMAIAVNLRPEARLAYQNEGWAGVKFVEIKAESKAA